MSSRVIFIILAIFFNAFANIFMKYGVQKKPVALDQGIVPFVLSYLLNFQLMTGIIFFGVALIFYTKALESFNLSIAYPLMTSSGIVITTLWSLAFFGESLSLIQTGGIIAIIAGIWLINL